MTHMQKTILITGGTGFLGVHLSRFLLAKGYKVVLLDTAPLTAKDLIKKVTVVDCDIRNKKKLTEAFRKIDFVVHAAAALPIHHERKYIFDVNVNGTKNVLDAAFQNKIKKVLFISTTAMYGVPRDLPERETSPLHPIGHYGESKAAAEKLCLEYNKKGLAVNIIRPKTFLGPERLGVFSLWFEAIHNNKPVFILGSGKNLYQLLEVKDLCQLILAGLLTKKSGQIYNAGAKEFGTWEKDLTALIRHAKSKSKIVGLPVLPSQIALGILEKFNMTPIVAWHYKTFPVDSYVSTEKAEKELNFKATKSNTDILIESYDWYKSHRSEFINNVGTTHRTVWNFKILDVINKFL